jgi:hypothetical protein
MYGPQAVSEQSLLEQAIHRLPAGAVVVGDANFGVFSVAYTAAQHDHPMLLRLTAARARHLAGEELRDGIDRIIQWKPSKGTRNNNLNEMGLGARFESVVPVWMGVVSMDGECFHLGL